MTGQGESYETAAEETETQSKFPLREVNILLLGETGVGKSTWINAIANYLNYDTLDDAIEAWETKPTVLIPSEFTMTNEDYEEIKVPIGDIDNNEVQAGGQSATQEPKTYRFQAGNLLIRVIDTPGIGDTRGIKQDKENFQKIMNHISHVDVIHGICVLLKPNNSRLNIFFEFCIKELMTQLHRDCIQNIAFCFTNARSTFYRPGDTLTALRALLKVKNSDKLLIPLGKKTIYCLDNEAFRFLAAVKFGQSFEDNAKANFAESWKTSVDETGRMVEYFLSLPPHETKRTVTLNTTRLTLIKLAKPLAEVLQTIQANIAVLKDKAEELKNLDSETKGLQNMLNIEQLSVDRVNLPYPRTVCTDPGCSERISVYETAKSEKLFVTHYKQVCHDPCSITGVNTDQLNCAELQGCAAMTNGVCHHCGHGWAVHMHITYDLKRKMINVVDQNVKMDLDTKMGRIKAVQGKILECDKLRRDNEREQEIITKTSAEFAVFLKDNSITPYNNAIIRYLDFMIEVEEENERHGGMSSTVKSLRETKRVYEEEEKLLLQAIADSSGAQTLSLDGINASLQGLYALPIQGATIRKLLDTATTSHSRRYHEEAVTPMQTSNGGSKKKHGFFNRIGGYVNKIAEKVGLSQGTTNEEE